LATSVVEKLLHPLVLSSVAVAAIAAFQADRWSKQLTRILFPPAPAPVTEVKSLLVNRLEGKTELKTAEVSLETVVKTSQDRMLGYLYLGETTVVYQGVGRVSAGVDLSQIDVKSVDRSQGHIHVTLPPPYLVQLDLDIEQSAVLEHHRAWFAPNVETDLYTKAQTMALQKIRAEACQQDLLDRANVEAETLVRDILETAKYEAITIDTQAPTPGTCPTS